MNANDLEADARRAHRAGIGWNEFYQRHHGDIPADAVFRLMGIVASGHPPVEPIPVDALWGEADER